MVKLEALEGYGVLVMALAMLAAFTLRMANPPRDVVRAASAPRAIAVLPEIAVPYAP
jgi:hypothetical protein